MDSYALRKRITRNLLWQYPDLGVVVLGVFVVWVGLCSVWPVLTIYMQQRGASLGAAIKDASVKARHSGRFSRSDDGRRARAESAPLTPRPPPRC